MNQRGRSSYTAPSNIPVKNFQSRPKAERVERHSKLQSMRHTVMEAEVLVRSLIEIVLTFWTEDMAA